MSFFSFVSCGSVISYVKLALPSLVCCMNCIKYFILLFCLFLARSRQVFRGVKQICHADMTNVRGFLARPRVSVSLGEIACQQLLPIQKASESTFTSLFVIVLTVRLTEL